MAKSNSIRSPKYGRQKRKSGDLAFVELNGRRRYLGRYGTKESKQKYHRLLAEWEANGQRPKVDKLEITVIELCARFKSHAESFYRKNDGVFSSAPLADPPVGASLLPPAQQAKHQPVLP